MPPSVTLSVIIPAYNEQDNFSLGKLDDLYDYLVAKHRPFEILLCDDGSHDDTLAMLRQFADNKPEIRVLALSHKGKGPTVKAGMLSAQGKIRLYTDFDQSTPITEFEKLLPFFSRGYDIAIGSREVQGALREKEPWYRHLMGRGFNLFVRMLAVDGIQDTQCGFKAFRDAATTNIFPLAIATMGEKKDSFTGAFDAELLFIAKRKGYRIAEVPVLWHHVKTQRVSPIKDSVRMLLQLLRLRFLVISGKYDV
jgi:dolichyl-phosphate beta-glucosyltransferase